MEKKETKIVELITAYIDDSLSEEQYNELTFWLNESKENQQLFSEYLLIYKKSRLIGLNNSINKDQIWNSLLTKIETPFVSKVSATSKNSKNEKQPAIRLISFMKYAALLIVLIASAVYLKTYFDAPVTEHLIISKEDIILKLDDGTIKVIANDGSEKVVNDKGEVIGNRNGNQLKYSKNATNKAIVEYNQLIIPLGKTFDLVLSDGTKVKLNAGSSFKYPVNFLNGKERQVFLTGEAFFDVAKDKNHPFIVTANDINVRVLGTQFNVSSYPEDSSINTVLVEGAVNVYDKNEVYSAKTATALTPGFKAKWSKSAKNISVGKADIAMCTAWIQNKLIFKNTPFKVIRKKLERKYNVSIENKNLKLDENTFNAVFDIETIEEVLEILHRNFGITYKIEENKVIII